MGTFNWIYNQDLDEQIGLSCIGSMKAGGYLYSGSLRMTILAVFLMPEICGAYNSIEQLAGDQWVGRWCGDRLTINNDSASVSALASTQGQHSPDVGLAFLQDLRERGVLKQFLDELGYASMFEGIDENLKKEPPVLFPAGGIIRVKLSGR